MGRKLRISCVLNFPLDWLPDSPEPRSIFHHKYGPNSFRRDCLKNKTLLILLLCWQVVLSPLWISQFLGQDWKWQKHLSSYKQPNRVPAQGVHLASRVQGEPLKWVIQVARQQYFEWGLKCFQLKKEQENGTRKNSTEKKLLYRILRGHFAWAISWTPASVSLLLLKALPLSKARAQRAPWCPGRPASKQWGSSSDCSARQSS